MNQSENESARTIWFSLPKEEETWKEESLLNDENGEEPHLNPQLLKEYKRLSIYANPRQAIMHRAITNKI